MKEIKGDLWDYYRKEGHVICITTNGTIKLNGYAVCGRGNAKEACKRIIDFEKLLGWYITHYGNNAGHLVTELDDSCYIIVFPVKHNWYEKASLTLITQSAKKLELIALRNPEITYILPRPGCGNGKLRWEEVKSLIDFLPDNVHIITRKIHGVI